MIALAWPHQYWFGMLVDASKQPEPALAGPRTIAAPEPCLPAPDSMDAAWLSLEEQACSRHVQLVPLESRKPSTRTTYLAKWKRFPCWVSEWNLSSFVIFTIHPRISVPSKAPRFGTLIDQGTPGSLPLSHPEQISLLAGNDDQISQGPGKTPLVRDLVPPVRPQFSPV